MANRQLQAVKTRIGIGNKVVTFKYKSVTFGPVFAKTDNELNQILEFCKYKKKEYESKEFNSKDYLMPVEAYQVELVKKWMSSCQSFFSKSCIYVPAKSDKIAQLFFPWTSILTSE